ncbi:hypothetical protein GCM10011490_24230 [Pseudoclavibacter endophyticus]|uniref:hypothetical protein n=1 Tax=Pseudoclavibacter endophyticus TaxID=1778590 RepID=UPI00166D879F|nr:hypothetical protein [Pseudoclavibacter endophyticus]GGA72610.1 hypothetical protein GCM10011490_24230 [Pseudoclavibacter endophyticus]
MSHHDTVERVKVEGPNGPFHVHPDLVKKFPDRYVPVGSKRPTPASSTATSGKKEA